MVANLIGRLLVTVFRDISIFATCIVPQRLAESKNAVSDQNNGVFLFDSMP